MNVFGVKLRNVVKKELGTNINIHSYFLLVILIVSISVIAIMYNECADDKTRLYYNNL